MKRVFKASFPSSLRKEPKRPDVYPKTFHKEKKVDLSFPIMKLQHRADYERESLQQIDAAISEGAPAFWSGCNGGPNVGTKPEDDIRVRKDTAERIRQLDAAIAILSAS